MEYAIWVADRARRMFQAFLGVDVQGEEFKSFLEKALVEEGIREPRSIPYIRLYEAVRKALAKFVSDKAIPK